MIAVKRTLQIHIHELHHQLPAPRQTILHASSNKAVSRSQVPNVAAGWVEA
jgi:hypothetical protein